MKRMSIRRPDDWHVHFRDEAMLRAVVPETARDCGRALVMPNLVPPVVTAAHAAAYRERILAAVPEGDEFEPVMTLYLTEETDPDDVERAWRDGIARAVKLYPAGATTNSQSGVRDFEAVRRVLERMAELGMPLCIHGEVTDDDVDIFDREAVFIDRVLDPLRRATPGLRVVMEHITTAQAVDYARSEGGDGRLAATITVHHLILNRNDLLAGRIRPHYYCLPIVKREQHRLALRDAATSGSATFFSGTDTAPHPRDAKENACGCAGIFSAPVALSCLAHVFEEEDALDRLEGFTSLHGARFHGVMAGERRIELVRSDTAIERPMRLERDGVDVEIFDPGFPLHWRVETGPAAGAGRGSP